MPEPGTRLKLIILPLLVLALPAATAGGYTKGDSATSSSRSTGGSRSGVTTREFSSDFPTRPRSPADAISGGYGVQIDDCDPRGLSHQTGSIYDHAPAIRLSSRTVGQWNRFHIRVVGQRYTVFLNGARVARLDGARVALGYVGLQNHDPGSRVSFRRIRARPLR
jgi:3-keto-disaccharide hydrolase